MKRRIKKSKLSELLKNLSEQDFKKLGDFMYSPFHNKSKLMIQLYDYFQNVESYKELDDIDKLKIFRFLYPQENYSDSRIRSLLSDFIKLVEKFLIYCEFEKNKLYQTNLLLNSYFGRNMSRNFESLSKELSNELKDEFNKNPEYYLNKYNFNHLLLSYEGSEIEVSQDQNYFDTSAELDNYFISSKLILINSLLSRKYHVFGNIKLNIKFSEEILIFIEENITHFKTNDPIIYTEYLILMMMRYPDKEKYFKLFSGYVLKNIKKFNQHELEQVYYPLCNYSFNKIALGNIDYLNYLFEIYKTFERKNFYSGKDHIQDIDFLSIILTGLKLKKIEWTENFLLNYRTKLPQNIKSDTIHLAKAQIHFYKKEYEQSIYQLNKVKHKNAYYYLKSKEIQMQIYYEKGEFEMLESLIDATRHYIKRHKEILFIHYNRYNDFLNFIYKLFKANENSNGSIITIKKELSKNMNAIGREWLLEKLQELKARQVS
jgi:hypothetical protein